MADDKEKQNGCPSSASGTCPSAGGSGSMAQHLQDQMVQSTLSKIKQKFLVMSGKGGVGKSSIAANLAVSLSRQDHPTGLLDVDLHGPSIATIMGIKDLLDVTPENLIIPWQFEKNLKVVSIQALMPEKDVAVIWRGPAKHGVIRQFLGDVFWGELDYLVIDSPPGTGDEPLSVAQTVKDAKAVIVATPQEVALADVRKSIAFCRKVGLSIAGVVENMGAFKCPHCGERVDLFPSGATRAMAEKMGVPFLGAVPMDPDVVKACDQGKPVMDFAADSPFVAAMDEIAKKLTQAGG
ncbi:MAG: Mrp/NBP35 family ATP-binding protein [Deltaproteobacteria bacterium]|nr:Mrp/NBP35 family ATP-binding protein [Deltaproteobacteria bacterium]